MIGGVGSRLVSSAPGLLLWSHAVVMDTVCGLTLTCWIKQSLPWKYIWMGAYVVRKPVYIFCIAYAFPDVKKMVLLVPMHTYTIRETGFELSTDKRLDGTEDVASVAWKNIVIWLTTEQFDPKKATFLDGVYVWLFVCMIEL